MFPLRKKKYGNLITIWQDRNDSDKNVLLFSGIPQESEEFVTYDKRLHTYKKRLPFSKEVDIKINVVFLWCYNLADRNQGRPEESLFQ